MRLQKVFGTIMSPQLSHGLLPIIKMQSYVILKGEMYCKARKEQKKYICFLPLKKTHLKCRAKSFLTPGP